jgi:wyosine [tRNA(Phe)-imidazoG37] synthetase (radical SAM superfamily)
MSGILFGPVPSRRLGRSLGVDLVPYKTCSFDCVYCELGPTTCLTKKRQSYMSTDLIINELEERLRQLKGDLDYITLAGSGEPTLNSDIGGLIEKIKRLTRCPVALLTNSSLLSEKTVRDELLSLDLIVPSLDAVSEEAFRGINRPVEGIEIGGIIEGLIKLREEFSGDLWLEVLICQGINDSESELGFIKQAIDRIQPDKVQLNTVFRPPSVEGTMPVSEERLKEIELFMGPGAEAVGRYSVRRDSTSGSRSVRTRVLMLLKRRPCTIEDISHALCLNRIAAIKIIQGMIEEGTVSTIVHQGEVYYRGKERVEEERGV